MIVHGGRAVHRHDRQTDEAALNPGFKGESQPSGYTEPLLHPRRVRVKAAGR